MIDLHHDLDQAMEQFSRELGKLQAGRAAPSLVEQIQVDYYGTMTPLQQLASISTLEAKVLVIQPFDANATKSIETAIQKSDLGAQPVADGRVIRIIFPPMTDERRQQLVKIIGQKAEEAKVRARRSREEAIKEIKQQEKDGTISEDARFSQEKETDADVKKTIESIDTLAKDKEDEIAHV